MRPTICFQSEIVESGAFTLPRDLPLPAEADVVEGVLNHFPFRAVLSGNTIEIGAVLQSAARVEPGDRITVELTRFDDEAEVRVPADLAEALKAHSEALTHWEGTTTKARRDWILWLLTAKQSKTRRDRVGKACDMLASGKRRVCCFGGLNWINKDHPISVDETWQF